MGPRASIRLLSIRGVPIHAHVTLLIGFALVGHLSFCPAAWLGLVALVLIHEAGHAVLLRRFHRRVLYIVLHGFGGECVALGPLSAWERAVVAWGGVLAQAALLGVILTGAALRIWPPAFVASDFYVTLSAYNIAIAALNLLPIRGLDGFDAWSIVRLSYLQARHAWLRRRLARRAPGAPNGRSRRSDAN